MGISDTFSGVKNTVVDLFGGNDKTLPYDVQANKIKKQQALADALRQQAAQPIETFSYDGVQAPIPWTAVLAKALGGVAASVKEGRAEKEAAELSKTGTDAAKDMYGEYFKTLFPDAVPTDGKVADIATPPSPGSVPPVPVPGEGAPDAGLPPAPGAAPAAPPPPGTVAPIAAGGPAAPPDAAAAPPGALPPGAPAPVTAAPVAGAPPPPAGPLAGAPTTQAKYAHLIANLSGEKGPDAQRAASVVMPEIIKSLRAEKMLRSMDLSQLPDDAAAMVQAHMKNGDIDGALKVAQKAMEPQAVGNDLIRRGPGGKVDVLYKNDPSKIDEYNFAKSPEGGSFKGTYPEWVKVNTANTHVTVNSGPPPSAEEKASMGAQGATGMPLNQIVPGYGKEASALRRAVRMDSIKAIMAENPGMSYAQAGTELAQRAINYMSGKKSDAQLATMLGATRTAVKQLDFNAGKVSQILKNMPSSDLSPLINGIMRGAQKWTGDPRYSELYYFMNAAAQESARIMSGGQASIAQLHAGAAEEAKKWADINMTPASWEAVAAGMREEADNRIQNYTDARGEGRVQGNHFSAPTPAPAAAKPAAAAEGDDPLGLLGKKR